MSLKNVVKANIYLSNLSRDFGPVNEVGVFIFSQIPASGYDIQGEGNFYVLVCFQAVVALLAPWTWMSEWH